MNFLDLLRSADPQSLAVRTEDARMSFGELVGQAERLRKVLNRRQGLRLFINTSNIWSAVISLAALDGIAEAFVLSSPELDPTAVKVLFARSECDAILSDREDLAPELPVIRDAADLQNILIGPRPLAGFTHWVMTTSGTTGQPKLVKHELYSLIRTTKRDQARGRDHVWGLLYDYTRFAGLQVLLQSVLSGATLVVPSTSGGLVGRIDFLADEGVTHLSATPTFWRKVLMAPGAARLPLRQITLGGEIADDAILSALTHFYPQARIRHIFASTEAGVGFSVTDGLAGFPTDFLKCPPNGVELRIENNHLLIRNEHVAPHYLGDGKQLARDGWVNTGDEVRIAADRVMFLGRSSGVINVGGDKVYPEEVEAAILAHPAVAMAHVYAKKNPIVGALIASDIIPNSNVEDPATLIHELKRWLAGRLERHKVPVSLRIVDKFETNSAGKIKRID
jgi:acyl-CoA synthetase (AMP-forming)/AMP-acid ligase II